MLNGHSPWQLHLAQNILLIFISLLFLPLDTFVLFISYAVDTLIPQQPFRRRLGREPGFQPKIILVTGVGMSKGLALARMFYEAGHTVIGADFEPYGIPVSGRFSKVLLKFYPLTKPNSKDGSVYYIQDLLTIVTREKVSLWVSCSGVASAVEDGQAKEIIEKRSNCKAIQFDVVTTATLHEKNTFIKRTAELGLPTPETHDVTTRTAVHHVLHKGPKKQYIMKSVGVDDAMRADMTILPRRTVSETYNHISRIPISREKPWILQQYIKGEEYCTHALVVDGHVKAFVACPSLELLMHYEALPKTSALSQAMLRFTQEFAKRSGPGLTGHLSFDFMVEEIPTEKGLHRSLYPIECNPRAHTAVVLFNSMGKELSASYMAALAHESNGNGHARNGDSPKVVTPENPAKYYWIGHDLVTLVLYPVLQLVLMKGSISALLSGCYTFLEHLVSWKDGTFEIWDPLPWWWLYHIYWPGQFLACILQGRRWSRINVSTTKMFLC
ncbi:hypothetical protein MMC19_005534 [Ptychographa xylographoides]|nr:hypothetical protein [Ptychographa xylographoides]